MNAKKDDSDDDLLRRAFRDVTPLKRRVPRAAVSPKPPAKSAAPKSPAKPTAVPLPPKPVLPELTAGAAVGVDFNTVRRLRRGKLAVEDRLDLHGHTQEAAFDALARFLSRAQGAGARTVLVITGKSGVLRGQVPKWLNAAPNRARVLSFTAARPADGGDGALYVLLKRVKAR